MSGDGRGGADDVPHRTDGGSGPENLTDLDGIGPARADKLRDAGYETVADVRGASQDELADVLGSDLAGRVTEQLDAGPAGGDAGTEPASGDGGGEPADSGPTVPSDSGGDEPADNGPSVPSSSADEGTTDDGPSVPSGTGDQSGADTGGQDDIGWETDETSDQPTTGGGEVEATVESGTQPTTGNQPTTGAQQTDQEVETTVTRDSGSDTESILAAIVSFFVPGIGHLINGQTERGLIIFGIYVAWLVVGWGIGFLLIGSILAIFTFGLSYLVLGPLVGLVDFIFHVLAAVDAYRGSKVVDNVTVKVNQVRGN